MCSSRYAMLQLTSNVSVLTSDPVSLYRHSESLIYIGSSTPIVKILGDEYEEFQQKFVIWFNEAGVTFHHVIHTSM